MPQNRIDAVLTPAQRANVATAVAAIRTNLPFLLGLSPEERQSLGKLGPASRAFAETALTTAQQNPQILPPAFSVTDFEEDLTLFDALEDPYRALEQLFEEISDTRMLASVEAMAAARAVLYYVRGTAAGNELDEAARQLGLRFARRRRTPPPTENPPEEPTA